MRKYWICVYRQKNQQQEKEYAHEPLADWYKARHDNGKERRYSVCFEQMREKDLVLCYETDSKSFKAVSEIHNKFDNTKINLLFKKKINVNLDTIREYYDDILALNAKAYSPFTKTGSNIFLGSFFATTKEQFELICSLDKAIKDNS